MVVWGLRVYWGRGELLRDDAGVGIRWDGMKLKIWRPSDLGSGNLRECLVQNLGQRWEFFATLSFMAGIGTLDGRHLKFKDVWATGGWVI